MPGGQDGVRVDALRLRGPAVETIKLEAELDATDQLEFPEPISRYAVQYGLHPQLAQLEMLVNPTVETLQADDAMANAGTLEIIPLEQPLTLFVWSKSRVVPVRLTDFSVTEEAFDPQPQPDPRQGQPGHARAERGRSGLLTSRRPHVHGLPRQQGTARLAGGQRRHLAFWDWEACHELSSCRR